MVLTVLLVFGDLSRLGAGASSTVHLCYTSNRPPRGILSEVIGTVDETRSGFTRRITLHRMFIPLN
jgi:hypothetical protein